VLVGIAKDDNLNDIETIAKKVLNVRVFDDEKGVMWKAGVKDIGGEVLCVSQFTLLANTAKGSKPDFHNAMGGESSKAMYATFLGRLAELYDATKIKGIVGTTRNRPVFMADHLN